MTAEQLISNFVITGARQLALLIPFFQLRECEYNVGSALTKGYLFAAATPLSISGSLGVLKQGFIFLLLGELFPKWTFPYRRSLLPKRFKLQGEVSSLLNDDGGTGSFRVEKEFTQLVRRLGVVNPESLKVVHNDMHWKALTTVFSLLGVICSVTPYIPSIYDNRKDRKSLGLAISFPLVRAFGSLLITVSIQYVLRYRLLALIKQRIIFMTIDKLAREEQIDLAKIDLKGVKWKAAGKSEDCIHALESYLSKTPQKNIRAYAKTRGGSGDTEMGSLMSHSTLGMSTGESPTATLLDVHQRSDGYAVLHDRLKKLMDNFRQEQGLEGVWERVRQLFLVVGVIFSIYGYFGSFVLVQNNEESIAPVVWLLLELALTAARSIIWASDPEFDEATAIELSHDQLGYWVLPPSTQYIGSGEPQVFHVMEECDIRGRVPHWKPLTLHDDTISLYYILCADPQYAEGVLHIAISVGNEVEVFRGDRHPLSTFYDARLKKDHRGKVTITVSGANPRRSPALVDQMTLDKIRNHYLTYYRDIVSYTDPGKKLLKWDLTEKEEKDAGSIVLSRRNRTTRRSRKNRRSHKSHKNTNSDTTSDSDSGLSLF